jgi:hypothetical protein
MGKKRCLPFQLLRRKNYTGRSISQHLKLKKMISLILAFLLSFFSGQYDTNNNNDNTIITTMDGDDTGGETGHIPPTPPTKPPTP